MKVFAYCYSDPLLESVPNVAIWGWELDHIYQDIGDRQQWGHLIEACQQDTSLYVLVRRLDELGDSIQEIGDRLATLETLGVKLIAVEEIQGEAHVYKRSDLIQLLQAIQSHQLSRRRRQGHARNRVKALPPPGKAPYGYRRGKERYILDRTTAPVVKDFFDHFLLYGSLRNSVRYLQKKYNKRIAVSTGQRWLTSPIYRGDLVYQTGDIVPNTHPPIISRQEAAQIDRLLRRNRRLPPRAASAPRSLSGLVICTACQSQMTITRVVAQKSHEYLYLRPMNCPNRPKCRALPYAEVLDQTIHKICEDLPRAVAQLEMPNLNQIKERLLKEIDARENVLAQLPALITTGVLDSETGELRAYKVRTEIAQLQIKLAQLPPVDLKATAQAVSIPQFWLDLSETERRFYFREFIRQIQIMRENQTWQLQLTFIFDGF
jgi:DNA invertase Pin-like site-specific DNA recombinase